MAEIYLLLGSNMGDTVANVSKALHLVELNCGKALKRSSLYETAAWGMKEQANFINRAVCIATDIEPFNLLTVFKNIEAEMGRTEILKWGPRVIDIDILFYGDEVVDSPTLKIPHPLIAERRFTLEPLNEIAPWFIHPVLKKPVAQLLMECGDESWVRKLTGRKQ